MASDSNGSGGRGAHLTWSELCVHITANRGCLARPILVNATGYAEPGSIMAIMGPSASGKSTLLDALAGRLAPNAVWTGDIMLNGESKATLSYGTAAYVTQENVLIGTLTAWESLMYSATLRLPDTTTAAEKRAIVDRAIQEMGLSACQHTRVGTSFRRGLSGGEKRRLSIALQILTRPRLLFLDEPTTGLDSAAAYFVVQTLRELAKDGRTVISSIHQPNSDVFALFDHLTLLSSGRTVFFGEAASASQFFAASNCPCPPMRNPSDHFLQTINADFDMVKTTLKGLQMDNDMDTADLLLPTSGKNNVEQVVTKLSAAYQESEYAIATRAKITSETFAKPSDKRGLITEGSKGRASFLRQCLTLTKRSFVNMTRDSGYYWIRFAIFLVLALTLGTIFWRVGLQYNSIRERAAVLVFAGGNLAFLAICGFPAFVEDMKVFHHERLNGHYGVAAFVISNTLASVPFLFLIALLPGTIVYFMAELHSGFGHYAFFVLTLFASSTCVESLMMAISSLVGRNYLLGIVLGAGIQAILTLVAGFYRLSQDIPKPVWRYPVSYCSFYTYLLKGLFKNDFPGLTFENFLGVDGKPIGADLSGTFVLKQLLGVQSSHGKWQDLSIIIAMIAIYRILFFVCIKLNETLGPRFRVIATEYLDSWWRTSS